jgi:hypothetical protein
MPDWRDTTAQDEHDAKLFNDLALELSNTGNEVGEPIFYRGYKIQHFNCPLAKRELARIFDPSGRWISTCGVWAAKNVINDDRRQGRKYFRGGEHWRWPDHLWQWPLFLFGGLLFWLLLPLWFVACRFWWKENAAFLMVHIEAIFFNPWCLLEGQ